MSRSISEVTDKFQSVDSRRDGRALSCLHSANDFHRASSAGGGVAAAQLGLPGVDEERLLKSWEQEGAIK
ncbi:hypothetical protein EVAR_97415_1 [Eumeta japonica]|uniref:Uncharacterized protein n=1 Tax=Eumeta variegata TaxID=151549 RepID=A0A4C1X0W5_EUMVA|nr:hypothetical protein EVAR_97415_1 [Eumeta japonica]